MIALQSRRAVRALDAAASERLGVPSIVLMENAGRGAFDAVVERFSDALASVVVICGPGQNGGDGWVLARHLLCAGFTPRAFLVGARAKVIGDALVNCAALERLGVVCERVENDDDLARLDAALAHASLIVDALLGTGLDRPLADRYAAVVERINACRAPVVALDLPTGIDADSGAVLGSAVQAALTVTFAAHKRGLHQYPAIAFVGELRCVSIGVPANATADVELIEARDVAGWLPARAPDAHKGSAGHVLIVGGSAGRTGAALLAGLGALRTGAGLCTIAADAETRRALDHKVVEIMTAERPLRCADALSAIAELAGDKQAVVIGPGLSLADDARALARQLAVTLPLPTVIDADALTALGQDLGILRKALAPRVLTPHPGEAGRLLGISSAQVQTDRYAAAKRLADQSGAVVVLKGACTIIAEPGGTMRVSRTGSAAMAVAGVGDVLAGVIAALLSHIEALDAASAGVYVHGIAGELTAIGERGLLASELAHALPSAILRCHGETPASVAGCVGGTHIT